jgi:hypothetical protein
MYLVLLVVQVVQGGGQTAKKSSGWRVSRTFKVLLQ